MHSNFQAHNLNITPFRSTPPPPKIVSTELTIKDEYIQRIEYGTGHIDSIFRIKNTDFRILTIDNCPSLSYAYALITRKSFVEKFYSLPYAFTIILRCETLEGDVGNNFNNKYHHNRPIVVVFETESEKKIFYKNHGVKKKFQKVEIDRKTLYDDLSFPKFINKFRSKQMQKMTVKNEQKLINEAAESLDLLTIRILHLFNRDLKPEIKLINRIIERDFENITLDGFLTIYDYNFLNFNSDELRNVSSLTLDDQKIIYSINNNMNYLMLSVKCGNKSAVKFFINHGVDVDYVDNFGLTAADHAYEKQDYDILSELIYANSIFPRNFNPKKCTNFNKLMEDTTKLHKLVNDAVIIEVDRSKKNDSHVVKIETNEIDKILQEYPNLCRFYDIANKSIATVAVKKKNFEIYRYLLFKGIYIGRFEDIEKITDDLTDDQGDKICLINANCAKSLPENHISILMANSTVCHDNTPTTQNRKILEDAFNELNEIDTIKPILKICAAKRNFKIIFDFNRDSVEFIDPGATKQTFGVFNIHIICCHIYVGAKQLLNEEKRNSAIASLAHELTHFAMLLTYENDCKPYNKNTEKNKLMTYKNMLAIYRDENIEKDEIVDMVFKIYKEKDQSAEFIVRAPHMTALYNHNYLMLANSKNIHRDLFDFYENEVLKDVENKIVDVDKKYKDELAFADGIRKKRQRDKIYKYLTYATSVIILLGIGVFLIYYYYIRESCYNDDNCKWSDFKSWTRRDIMDSDIMYQGYKVKFRDAFEGNDEALNQLDSRTLRNHRDLRINDKFMDIPSQFLERKFIKSSAKLWTTKSKRGFEQVYRDKKYDFNSLRNMMLASSKLMLIAGEPLDGRTSVMRKINRDLRNSTNWVTLIEMKSLNITYYDDIKSEIDLIKFIKSAAELSPFENEIFKVKLAKGEVVILIDGIDSIYPHHENFTNNLLNSLELNFKNKTEMWITTRDSFKSNVEKIFNARSYKLLPLDVTTRENFLKLKLSHTNSSSNITEVRKFIENVEVWRDNSEHQIFNVYLLNALIDKKLTLSNATLYEIVENYTRRILGDELQSEIDGRENILQKISMEMIRKKFNAAFQNIDMKILIATMNPRELKFSDNWNVNDDRIYHEIKFGILKNGTELKFIHKLIFEFYISKFIKEQIIEYGQIESVHDNYINFLFNVAYDVDNEFELVRIMIEELMNENRQKFSEKFRKSFKRELKKFYQSVIKSTLKDYPDYSNDEKIYIHDNLKKMFKGDEKMMCIIEDDEKFIEDLVLPLNQ